MRRGCNDQIDRIALKIHELRINNRGLIWRRRKNCATSRAQPHRTEILHQNISPLHETDRTDPNYYFLPAAFFFLASSAPCVACAAFLAVFSCSALASLSRRCSGVSPSSRPLVPGFRACARCRSRSLWSPRAAASKVKEQHGQIQPKHNTLAHGNRYKVIIRPILDKNQRKLDEQRRRFYSR
ncbi:hypothetical protein VPH35_003134 [Triticum aestivum]